MEAILALLLPFGLLWLVLIRPQQRRMQQHQAIVASLEVGDEIVTAGGVYGVIQSVDDDILELEVAPGVVIKVLRSAVTQRLAPDNDTDAGDAGAALADDERNAPSEDSGT